MIQLTRPACPFPAALHRDYRYPRNKSALREACFDKCMYCESKVTDVYWGDVEHIRPKARFPELEFDWNNLGFVCGRCNGKKSDQWSDDRPFIDPFNEDPSEHLAAVGQLILHKNGSERGEYTWRKLDLNRPQLLEQRMERIKEICNLVDKIARTRNAELAQLIRLELEAELADQKEYAMASRAAYAQLRTAPVM